jgi:tetratricopeptide (TPR) repeat protein
MVRGMMCWIAVAITWFGGGPFVPHADAAGIVDRVRFGRNSDAGEVVETTPIEITLDKGAGGTRKLAVNELRSLLFDGEPTQLTQARLNVRNGGYATALDTLNEIDLARIDRDLVREDVEFYKAICAAKLALGGTGKIADAGRQLNEFVRTHPQNFHYLEAVEVMGDLLMASDKFERAERQYAELAKAPWPDFQMRAGVLTGRSLQAQGKHAEAIQQFDAVLALTDDSEPARDQKFSATLGKAMSLAETGHLDDAVRMIEGVIQNANPEQKELQARAYNALGACYEQAGQAKDALLAFLHVDVLYSTVPEAHAEALTHLIPLWRSVGQEARAREAQQVLDDRYAGSRSAR